MAETKQQGGQQQSAGAGAGAQEAKQQDPRFTRAPQNEAGFETRSVCGYDAAGNARTFNLLKGEKLPDGWADAPPEGTHPNDPKGAA